MSEEIDDRGRLAGPRQPQLYSSRHSDGTAEGEQDKTIADSSSDIANNLAALTDSRQKAYVEGSKPLRKLQRLAERLSKYNIEGIGITPLTLEQRTGTQWWSPGLIWFSANVNGEFCMHYKRGRLLQYTQ
jgi:hypothetical protein